MSGGPPSLVTPGCVRKLQAAALRGEPVPCDGFVVQVMSIQPSDADVAETGLPYVMALSDSWNSCDAFVGSVGASLVRGDKLRVGQFVRLRRMSVSAARSVVLDDFEPLGDFAPLVGSPVHISPTAGDRSAATAVPSIGGRLLFPEQPRRTSMLFRSAPSASKWGAPPAAAAHARPSARDLILDELPRTASSGSAGGPVASAATAAGDTRAAPAERAQARSADSPAVVRDPVPTAVPQAVSRVPSAQVVRNRVEPAASAALSSSASSASSSTADVDARRIRRPQGASVPVRPPSRASSQDGGYDSGAERSDTSSVYSGSATHGSEHPRARRFSVGSDDSAARRRPPSAGSTDDRSGGDAFTVVHVTSQAGAGQHHYLKKGTGQVSQRSAPVSTASPADALLVAQQQQQQQPLGILDVLAERGQGGTARAAVAVTPARARARRLTLGPAAGTPSAGTRAPSALGATPGAGAASQSSAVSGASVPRKALFADGAQAPRGTGAPAVAATPSRPGPAAAPQTRTGSVPAASSATPTGAAARSRSAAGAASAPVRVDELRAQVSRANDTAMLLLRASEQARQCVEALESLDSVAAALARKDAPSSGPLSPSRGATPWHEQVRVVTGVHATATVLLKASTAEPVPGCQLLLDMESTRLQVASALRARAIAIAVELARAVGGSALDHVRGGDERRHVAAALMRLRELLPDIEPQLEARLNELIRAMGTASLSAGAAAAVGGAQGGRASSESGSAL